MTKEQLSNFEVDQKFLFAFVYLYTTCTFSEVLKMFTIMNSFATAKLINLETYENHEDNLYVYLWVP